MNNYDVIVIGAGHAGCEAALASARLGFKTLILTMDLDNLALMPCNPAIGGPAKSQIVREIDALGGEMAKNIDRSCIQLRLLNTGKGPAVQAFRAQADKKRYHIEMKHVLEQADNLILRQGIVEKLLVENKEVKGVYLKSGVKFKAKKVIITAGTYLKGEIIIGKTKINSGPQYQFPANKLAQNLRDLGFEMRRFKTGTPPRIDRASVDFDKLTKQKSFGRKTAFSFTNQQIDNSLPSKDCYLVNTNQQTHQVILNNLERSPMFSGEIDGEGARYCPSIETKVHRFPDKSQHQLYLEPEGVATDEMYLAGFSTSLPYKIQLKMLHTLVGFKEAKMIRPAYAIEYDCLNPLDLKPTLETKLIDNLYTAGQINGTSGYEEAAGQGIVAGINAALSLANKKPLILARSDAYIGVLIDDLVTKGTNEPYRMLTSRAEYRLVLRQDNADLRLTELGYELGLISEARYKAFLTKKKAINSEIKRLQETKVGPKAEINNLLKKLDSTTINQAKSLATLIKRPELNYQSLKEIDSKRKNLSQTITKEVEIKLKYEGYIKQQVKQIKKQKEMEAKKIPASINYQTIDGLRLEAREKLEKIEPVSIGQAARIPGVSPADISVLSVYLKEFEARNGGE